MARLTLSGIDEHFNHQIALPHHVVGSSDPNWRERYWISVHDIRRTDYVLSFGFGKYPNRDVMEGFAIFARGEKQQNVRASRKLLPRHDQIVVGPLTAEIVKPLEELRFTCGDNPGGVSFDLTWRAAAAPALEGRHFEVSRSRVTHDLVRYVQTGRVAGSIKVAGERFDLTEEHGWGVRDHSWGVRPMAQVPGDPPRESPEWNFLFFCPIQFQDFSVHFYLFESKPGRPTHLSASIMRHDGGEGHDDEIKAVTHDFQWREGAPVQTLDKGVIDVEFFDGRRMRIDIKGCAGRAYLAGGGYGTTHGKWFSEDHLEHEVYDLTDASQLKAWHNHSSDHLIEAQCEGQQGYGVIEYFMRRAYRDKPSQR